MRHLKCSICGIEWDIPDFHWLEAWQDEETGKTMCKEHLALAAGLDETSWRGNEKTWGVDADAPDHKRYLTNGEKADKPEQWEQLPLIK
jgi:hypothetical protein